jgi:hypothetical protein
MALRLYCRVSGSAADPFRLRTAEPSRHVEEPIR